LKLLSFELDDHTLYWTCAKVCAQKDILDLTGDIDESKMQILIILVSAILKIPPQLESMSATLAAIFCKSMLREVCL